MQLYTRKGDDGLTELFGGLRVDKDARRVDAIGFVDELNAQLGVVLACCEYDPLRTVLSELQHQLFELGADLAAPEKEPGIKDEHVCALELHIDRLCNPLAPLKNFILPGGSELAARLHVARTVCRHAERRCVSLHKAEAVSGAARIYLNRLGDLLFAMARRANQLAGQDDVPWISR